MKPDDDIREEERFTSLLAGLDKDAAPPAGDVLARLRAHSTDAFAAATATSTSPKERNRPMILRVTRWLGATAVAAVIGCVGVYFWLASGTNVAFGQILQNSETSKTINLVVRNGDKTTAFLHDSGDKQKRSRWDFPDGTARIAKVAQSWTINEPANQVHADKRLPAAVQPLRQFLDQLGVPAQRDELLSARPVEQIREKDIDLLVYRVDFASPDGPVSLEARVDADSRRLKSLRTWINKAGRLEPLGELTVIAYDQPLAVEKFLIADTLTEDGRIGNVTDVQGIVSLKPVLQERWTPVREHLVLRPGDWVRTDARGANAVALRLMKKTGVILGPKTLVELISPKRIRLLEGEIEITAADKTEIELVGPRDQKLVVKGTVVKGTQLVSVQKEQLVRIEKTPAWLLGFKGATTNETLGSLVALVDGRNMPLHVGYHKVTVEIRDQIARTTIEESFVNSTNAQLEGVFHFPLPQDASISGFGMWIGEQYVEADVVEKQRAREIYETILREKRDPGLLEWSGGNIFKARVFPIFANSEKRIKITYTQVLPQKGSRYCYSYALQSELLQQHPLRELSIDVKVNSVVPLKNVSSPTHPARTDRTAHSAHVEFTAQEYVPTRDFEVVVETDGRLSDVVAIPHRRGDDGYFMIQLTPPGPTGDWTRPLLPDGEPVHLVILADTSASIDAGQRATQAAFVGSLLSSLTPKDTFNLGACDVAAHWAFPQPAPADAANIAAARDFLAKRISLGWTDLDAAFAAALKQCGPKSHVIYVGDGIVTTGDADPAAFAKRLRQLHPGQSPPLHAVSLGSSYESAVLKAIASLGGGSLRKITGEQGPQAVALELLGEIAQPALRDVKVEFQGIKAARVYPESLANVPSGSQQILLGRYLPEGRDQAGEIIVTGTQGGKPVRFSTRVSLKDAELGNSFIPRLWARMHLDNLLEQGTSETIKDEIIALSEDFQIITPYTSLLVLETDADRERFKVKRRFQMRDGERFFADGRDNAVFDLKQKQMKNAGAWRTALRRSILSELAGLGWDAGALDQTRHRAPRGIKASSLRGLQLMESLTAAQTPVEFFSRNEEIGGYPLQRLAFLGDEDTDINMSVDRFESFAGRAAGKAEPEFDRDYAVQALVKNNTRGFPVIDDTLSAAGEDVDRYDDLAKAGSGFSGDFDMPFRDWSPLGAISSFQPLVGLGIAETQGDYLRYAFEQNEGGLAPSGGTQRFQRQTLGLMSRNVGARYGQWTATLFPALPEAPRKPLAPKSKWPADARDLAKSLLRADQLAKMANGLQIVRESHTFDTRWNELSSRSTQLELASAKAWLVRSASDGGETHVSWCDGKEIGIFSKAFQLGRVRAATPLVVQPPSLTLADYSLASLEQTYAEYAPTLEPQGKDRTLLKLKLERSPLHETRILVDTARHVILTIESRHKDKVTAVTQFDDFVEAAGSWWARRIETFDDDGKRASLVTQAIKTLPQADFDKQMAAELAGRAQVQLLRFPMPSLTDAKKAIAAGKGTFDDQFLLMVHFHRSQQWPRMFEHLQAAETLSGKPGLRWLRSALLNDSRRHEELRKRYLDDAARLAKGVTADEYFLAEYIYGQTGQVLEANEMLVLLESLRPLYEKQPPHLIARKHWHERQASSLSQAGRTDEALRVQKQLATEYLRDVRLQQQYAQALAGTGDYPAAYAWLTRVLGKDSKWNDSEEERLRSTYCELLERQGRFADLVEYLAPWIERNPLEASPYEHYLGALVKADFIEKADGLALRWLKEAQKPVELSTPESRRAEAAIAYLIGNVHRLHTNRIAKRWLPPLAEAAGYFAKNDKHEWFADRIVTNTQFKNSDLGNKVRKTIAGAFVTEIGSLSPEKARRLLGWFDWDDVDKAGWEKITATLRKRSEAEPNDEVKDQLARVLLTILGRQGGPGESLAFTRLQWQKAADKFRADYANQLFAALLEQPWTAEFEAEAFGLLDKLSTAEESGRRLVASVAALHRLTDQLYAGRVAAATKLLTHPEKLTRTELMKKQEEIRRQAREGVADRLKKEAGRHPKQLAQWLVAESLYLDILLDRNLKQATAEAWEYLGAAPPGPRPAEEEATIERALDEMLRQRYFVTQMNLAARKGADAALVERLGKYIDQGVAADAENGYWKNAKYRFLIAVDRTKDLEATLRQWSQGDGDSRWRIALGNLLAEQGRVADAIGQFEAVEAADELTPGLYRTLADWYLIQGQREAHERAANAVYKTASEGALSNAIHHQLQSWQSTARHGTTELDKDVLRMFSALFERSSRPEAYLFRLQQFYDASHDFRLLSGLPDAVLGQTAGRVYPFVKGMQSVLNEVRDEATADEILKQLAVVRARAKTAVDLRALDMLEAMVERRAAEVQNQPGPHLDNALKALVNASKREWSPGEPRLMADFLANLGRITQPKLAEEQLRQLKGLHNEAKPGSLDRLHIARRHAETLSAYGRIDDAIDLLQVALDERQAANAGVLPADANNSLAILIGELETAGRFVRGENVLLAQLKHPVHAQQRRWLDERLNELYLRALKSRGQVSFGRGISLYRGLERKLRKQLDDGDEQFRYQMISLLCQVYSAAHEKMIAGVADDARALAFQTLPAVLKRQSNHYDSAIRTVAHSLREVAGPLDGIVFLLDQIDSQPRWLRYANQDVWNHHATTIADWRREVKDMGKADARLLKAVLAELRRDLDAGEYRSRSIYFGPTHTHFWKEKAADFAKTAESVLAERNQSGPAVQYIANYLFHGLHLRNRAIEILFVANNQKVLDESGQAQLVDYLHRQRRFGESIALLQPLVERHPENLDYRVQLMHAYFRTARPAELLALLKATDAYFHSEKHPWEERPMVRLAQSTLENELYEQSVAYFKELIPLCERTHANRGIGEGTLSRYYVGLANAYAGLKKTPEAVDAAGGAIVAWGPRLDHRAQALDTLRDVLLKSPDLDAFVVHFDGQKQDSAIVRKGLGQAYRSKGAQTKAIEQWERAVELQPNDAETQQWLVEAYDQAGDKAGALRKRLQSVQLSRRDLKLYQDIGERYVSLGQPHEAERAYTSIVEMQANESESHALLAEIREKQNRWPEAIAEWEHVARLRSLEPTGLLKLAAAQIHESQWDAARATIRKLESRTWPTRFSEVRNQIRALERLVEKR